MRRKRSVLIIGMLVLALYLLMPLGAGGLAIGDRRGPKLYPQPLHELLYLIGWEMCGNEGKPRVRAIGMPPRSWFYWPAEKSD